MKILIEVDAIEKPHGFYVDVDAIRLVIEGGKIVGWYAPNGLEADPVTTGKLYPCDCCEFFNEKKITCKVSNVCPAMRCGHG